MLSAFLEWGSKKREQLARSNFNALLTIGEITSNPSARLDIDGDKVVARITAWNSGDIDLEIINIETEIAVYSKQICLCAPFRFDDEFSEFFMALGFI